MTKIVRYNGNLLAFASSAIGTERTLFGEVSQANDITSQITADFLRGWGIVGPSDQPALEDFNAVSYTLSQILAYLHQVGVAEYNASQEYYIGSFTSSSGLLYVSLTDGNIGNTPASSPASWRASTSGRLLRTSVYRNNAGALQVSIDGAAFANSGSTFTPIAATTSVIVQALGGGGGGGGAATTGAAQTANGSGGGAGGYGKSRLLTGFSGVTVAAGAGGTAAAGVAGGNGGTSSFGGLISSAGGQGGVLGAAQTSSITAPVGQASGGTSTGGNMISSTGATGKSAFYGANNISGTGGDSVFGGGAAFVSGISAGNPAISPGSGGSGAALPASSGYPAGGGTGATGLVIIEEYA